METTRLDVQTPCCHRPVRLVAVAGIPRETYERTCATCGVEWAIERTTLRDGNRRTGRIDQIAWELDPPRYRHVAEAAQRATPPPPGE